MGINELTPGYEIWHPNREKQASKTTRLVIVLLLILSAALMVIVLLGGWSVLTGGTTWGVIGLLLAALYLLLARMIWKWSRGALTLSTAMSVLLLILFTVGVSSWFARNNSGFAEPALPVELVGILMVFLIPVQAALAVVTAIGFNQQWYVEEERLIGSGGPDGEEGLGDGEPAAAAG
jgi:hypothetical protein